MEQRRPYEMTEHPPGGLSDDHIQVNEEVLNSTVLSDAYEVFAIYSQATAG